jgi:MOSC domain-containing protein YiiM
MTNGKVLSVNIAEKAAGTGIHKRPTDHAVAVRAPGPKQRGRLSGLVGDHIGSLKHHGGDDQAVYVYAREDYDWWEAELGRDLPDGFYGENLTTAGIDVNGSLIGDVWQIGHELRLQTTFGRIPCATFQRRMAEPRWVKRFTQANRTGAYLRVLTPGEVRAGDPIQITDRPAHSLTIAEAFHIYLHEPQSMGRLLAAEALPTDMQNEIRNLLARNP